MYSNLEWDQKLISSLEFYYRNGDPDLFLKEAWGWAWALSRRKFRLDDDSCADIVLKLVHDVEHIMKVYQEGNYTNFPAFLTTYVKHLVLNQKKKNVIRAKMEIVTDDFYTDRFPKASTYDFTQDILEQAKEISLLVRETLDQLDPLASLVIKMKHRIRLNLKECRIFKQRLSWLGLGIRQYFDSDREEEIRSRIRKRNAEDQLKRLFQSLYHTESQNRTRWNGARKHWSDRHSGVPEEKSFRKIAYYLGMSQHSVRTLYYSTVTDFKKKERWRSMGWRAAA
ncbi:RNA polymerase subunit sigma-70 [Leptospira langatensis]|uniref:RNA polymerase subunit sigma-70 n=1 Tax=Leptospira langatensis TaxID=2484983 RepID=A0A5F1ZY14_9LEPT|nr:RNA polymerase subunit sigma-70 [Leptospira langatensis]TGJ99982.1 RNA polymerase subunit sigma-70 [Leptospira langatensis]TGL42620.1 RNA polymerase subunit sigma-70 [Leptospira langatensis]